MWTCPSTYWTAWSTTYTNSAGSDISAVTADDYIQYLVNLTTDSTAETPTIVKQSGYDVRLTYGREGTASSSDIPLHWVSGWLDFGQASNPKVLRSIETRHLGTSGTLTVTIEDQDGDTDTFNIDLSTDPTYYKGYFSTGALNGTLFKVDIEAGGILPVRVEKIIIHGQVEPYV